MRYILLLIVMYCSVAVQGNDENLKQFASGNQKFTAGVYKGISENENGNFVYSPLSVELILSLTNEGAKGDTAEEVIRGLSFPSSQEKTRRVLKSLLPTLQTSDENLKLLSANKIYIAEDVKLEDDFNSTATDVYRAGVQHMDFSKNEEASAKINEWVEENTNNKIHNLITPDDIQSSTKLILVNALYFSGKWIHEFKEYDTSKRTFHKTKDSSTEVDLMQQTDSFNFYESPTLKAKFLELPYIGDRISMVIVLPNEIEGLASLEQNIEQVLAPPSFTRERVDVSLPRFTIETEIQFVPILRKLGVNKLFSGGDLSGISSTDKYLAVSEVIQKAFINVTELGTEAAAATLEILLGSGYFPEPPKSFVADHPFLYYITVNGVIAFCGRYVG